MYSKPLLSRTEGLREAPTTKMNRGVPLNGAVNFASFMPQGLTKSPSFPGQANEPSHSGTTPLEQAAMQSNLGFNQMQAMAALTANASNTATTQEVRNPTQFPGQSTGLPLNQRDLFRLLSRSSPDTEAAQTAVRVKSHRKEATPQAKAEGAIARKLDSTLKEWRQKTDGEMDTVVGKLAAQFESGSKGIAAIGHDRHGGTSYGKYQISSRAGTMKAFIDYCKTEAPDIAERFEKCGGPMNTGGRRGKMPTVWTQIAEAEPTRFEALQDKFIRASHFEPAMRAIAEKTGVGSDDMPFALQEVIFSTAVQHGPGGATRIISRALDQIGQDRLSPESNDPASLAKAHENLIRRIYDSRSGQFRSSTESVQASVKNRLKREMSTAITMLRQETVA